MCSLILPCVYQTVAMKPGVAENRQSGLLSREEHQTLAALLGAKCQSLSTSVVQLFLTDGPDHSQWRRKDAGVLCFVKDHYRRSYFFRLFCLTRRSLIWEQQVYNDMEYTSPRSWLHTFEAEYSMAAFNFASEDEAESFRRVVLHQLEAKRQRRIERRSRASLGDVVQGSMPNLTGPTGLANGPGTHKHHRSASSGATASSKKKDKKLLKAKIKKEDIGLPQNFRHVGHVGWDPVKGFDVDLDRNDDPNLRQFFAKAGVSDVQLQDKDTREFIYQFIQRNGGLAAVKDDVVIPARAPPVPSRGPQPTPTTPHKPSPPPPPPSLRACPPTPSQQRTAPPPPPPPSVKPAAQGAPAPPPPPPPPMMADLAPPTAPPPPPAATFESSSASDPRSALFEAIKSGKTLKHVEHVEKKVDSRNELLESIRQGVELKSVQPIERPAHNEPAEGLAGALARALAERSRAFHDSESESDSGSAESDSEWEE